MKKILIFGLSITCFISHGQMDEEFLGSWSYCLEGDYYEIHFRGAYFENCSEYGVFGVSYPYKIQGDTITYGVPNRHKEMIYRKFEFLAEDSLKWYQDFTGKYHELLLVRMEQTIMIPGSRASREIVDSYESDFKVRLEKSRCRQNWEK